MTAVAIIFCAVTLVAVIYLLARRSRHSEIVSYKPVPPLTKLVPVGHVLNVSLSKTRAFFEGGIQRFCGKQGADWGALEEALLGADVSLSTTRDLIAAVKKMAGDGSAQPNMIQKMLADEALRILESPVVRNDSDGPGTRIISVIGVNGVGKTTTIGKLCALYSQQGKSVLVGAADTFRAAAVDQLRIWAERSGADFVAGREGGDPAAVVFDALSAAVARQKDILIIDTAGRLHTKVNLIEELKKMHRVMKKIVSEAPHEVLLVIDGTLGQNSVQQARQFGKELGVTGIVVTKLDGTAKGGAVLTISQELAIPIRYVGVGEGAGDLVPFDAKSFVEALIGNA